MGCNFTIVNLCKDSALLLRNAIAEVEIAAGDFHFRHENENRRQFETLKS